jgi:two-component system CheB/CheR fusion protein
MLPDNSQPGNGATGNAHPPSSGATEASFASAIFPVVGVAASAGGLEAFTELLGHMKEDSGVALLLVQHLDPHRESMLATILGSTSRLPVAQATDGEEIRPNRVYIIPPNASMSVEQGRLRMQKREPGPLVHMPADILLRSMAAQLGPRAVAVILSGGGTDGTLGTAEIKAAGGITFAQDEHSAKHDSMPMSAIATGYVDYVMPPAAIAAELARIASPSYLPRITLGGVSPVGVDNESELRKVLDLVRKSSGVDFSQYKRSTMLRRIQRRMALRRRDSIGDFIGLLREDPEEVAALHNDLLIRVTHFFRDPGAFQALEAEVFPGLIRNRRPDDPIRIWVAGCSTGEEVYSIAITLVEALGDDAADAPIKILATDVSNRYLDVARAGTYIENIAMDVSTERLRRFFRRVNGHYQVSKLIRDLCIFSKHDLIRDAPFAHLDLISCRNVLIYLDLPAQKRVMPMFHYALNPGGHLMLGPSETIGTFGELFSTLSPEHKIFTKKLTAQRAHVFFDFREPTYFGAAAARPPVEPVGADLAREVDRLLLEHHTPPSVLVDEDGTILQVRGRTSDFLRPPIGVPNPDVMRLTREGLRTDLQSALAQARSGAVPARRRVTFTEDGRTRVVEIRVLPLLHDGAVAHFLLLFRELPVKAAASPLSVVANAAGVVAEIGPEDPSGELDDLRGELQATREHLQSVVEEYEATTEELKSANEEILSSNEELRSTNEELQTAKEEMQSANEELSTVNDEMKHRNAELARVNDDLVNLFSSVNIPIVMVSRDLRIRSYTTTAERMLNLIPTDVGRPINHIRPNIEFPDLDRRLADVIESLAPQEFDVRDRSGRWFSARIRPYITVDNKIDGAVLAVVDVDAMRQNAERLRQARENADAIVETVWQPLVVLDDDLRLKRGNASFYRTFGLTPERAIGRPLYSLLGGPWDQPALVATVLDLLGRGRDLENFELDIADDSRRAFVLNSRRIDWHESQGKMILVAIEEITERKRVRDRDQQLARAEAARVEAELANRKKDEFLALLAHELRNPLAPILNALLVVRSSGVTAADQQWANTIMERQVRHMARLIDDLLDVSRVMRGLIQLRKERADLGRLVGQAVDSMRSFIESRGHTLTVDVAEGVPVDVDCVRFEQVVVNLLNNAAKYTDEGGEIHVSATREGPEAVVRVRDTGLGITPEFLPQIFDLFMQADRSLDRSMGGLGIGLTLVKNLVDLHGGRVSAHSEGLGRGSEFVVRLPVSPGADARPDPSSQPAVVGPSRRVLIVEDNVDSARTLARLLTTWGHETRVVHDGDQALPAAREFRPDIVLMDIGLPQRSGYEIAAEFRADPETRDVILVAVTGYGQEQDRAKAQESGFDLHMVKPADETQLRSALAVPARSS